MQYSKRINWPLLIVPVLVFSLGFITLFSTSPDLAKNQIIFFVIGIGVYLAASLNDYRILRNFWLPTYIICAVLLVVTFLLGNEVFGAARWLKIGVLSIQPSEFAKIVLVLTTSHFVADDKLSIKLVLFVIPVILLVFLQPDLGTAISLLIVVAAILWFGGLNKIYYLIALAVAGIFSTPVWNALKDYQKERILVFLNPSLDVLGSGYNVIQSSIAVGSGRLFGRGFGRGTQSHLQFLPVYWTDFIFAAFAEEWGFIGVVVLLILYSSLLFCIAGVAVKTVDKFGRVACIGIFVIFFFQFVVNVGMNLGLMPVTGIPLPLVSYGGSSMVVSMFLLGFVQSVWINKKV